MNYNFDKVVQCGHWEVQIDTAEGYGCFEDAGSGSGGGLWFDKGVDGKLTLYDYDGMTHLPTKVALGIVALGFVVPPEFDN